MIMTAIQSHPLDRTLAALADPTRRALLDQLRAGEQPVSALAHPHKMSLNAVSKHIKVLEQAGLVQRRREGRTHYLSFEPDSLDAAADWISETRAFWNARLDALEAALIRDDELQKKGK